MKVFLSHSSTDKALARRLATDLKSANVDVWLDQWDLLVGQPFAQRIEQGLESVDFVIVLLTRASVGSAWVDREWRQKVQHEAQSQRIAVVAVRGEPCEIPEFLAQRSQADISGGSYPLGLRHLLTLLQHHSGDARIALPQWSIERGLSAEERIPVVTPIALEVAADLIPLVEPDEARASRVLDELIPRMRDGLMAELGFRLPGIRVRGNTSDMPGGTALIMVDEIPELMMTVSRERLLAHTTAERLAALGIAAEPATAGPAAICGCWIAAADGAAAAAAGVHTSDAFEFVLLVLSEVIRRMASSFLDIDVVRDLVDAVEAGDPALVARAVPAHLSWFELTEVLQRLVDEGVCIADTARILEALVRCARAPGDADALAEHARQALCAQITVQSLNGRNALPVLQVDAEIEALIDGGIRQDARGRSLDLDRDLTQVLLAALRTRMQALPDDGNGVSLLVIRPQVRPFMRRLVSQEFPSLRVLSQQDLEPGTPTRVLATLRLVPGRPPPATR